MKRGWFLGVLVVAAALGTGCNALKGWMGTPVLRQPADSAVFWNLDTVVFVWDTVENAEQYELQISTRADFQNPFADIVLDPWDSSYVWALNGESGLWFWRMRALRDSAWSPWSEVRVFLAEPRVRSDLAVPGTPERIQRDGNQVYAALGTAGLLVARLSGDQLIPVDTLPQDGYTRALIVRDTLLVVASGPPGGLRVYRLTSATPSLIGAADTLLQAWDVDLRDSLLAVADGVGGTRVYVLRSGQPVLLAQVPVAQNYTESRGVALVGNHLFILEAGNGDGRLRVMDLSQPSQPLEVGQAGSVWLADARRLALNLPFGYAVTGSGRMVVFNLQNPYQPAVVQGTGYFYTTPVWSDVAITGTLALVASGSEGLLVVDLTDGANPRFVAHHAGMRSARGVAFGPSGLLLVAHASRISVLEGE